VARYLRNPKITVSVVFVAAMFMSILDATIVNVALPAIGRDFDASISTVGAVASGYLVSLAVFIPASGWLGDRFGTRRIFLLALAGFVVASALCGAAGSLGQLVLFRVLQGAAGGMMIPVGMAMLYRVFPQDERVAASRILIVPTAAGPALGPVLGGVLVEHLSWHWAFLINVPVGAAVLAFGLRFLPRDEPAAAGRFDLVGFLLAGAGLGLAMLAVSEGPSRGWGSPLILAAGATGLLLLTALVPYELRIPAPLLRLRLLRERLFRRSFLVLLPSTAGFLGLLYAFPQLQQEGLGRSALTSGLLTFPEAIGVMLGSQLVGRLYPRIGPRRLMTVGALGVAVGALLLTRVTGGTPDALVVVLMLAIGLAMSSVFMPINVVPFANVSQVETSQATAIFNAFRQVGAAVGVAMLATTIALVGPVAVGAAGAPRPNLDAYHAAFLVAAGLMLLAALMALRIRDADAAATFRRPVSVTAERAPEPTTA
jgi:EmrB/QacA subfamily drug resistance transporter